MTTGSNESDQETPPPIPTYGLLTASGWLVGIVGVLASLGLLESHFGWLLAALSIGFAQLLFAIRDIAINSHFTRRYLRRLDDRNQILH